MSRRRGWYARTLDLPHGPGTVRLELDDAAGHRADRVREGRVPARTTCATPRPRSSAPAGWWTPTATRWRSTTSSSATRSSARWSARPAACGCPARSTATRPRSAPWSASRSAVTGARTVTGRLVAAYGTPVETDVPGLTHLFPSAATLAVGRSRGAADAARAGPGAGRAGRGAGRGRRGARPGRRPRRRTRRAGRAARHRPLDRRLRRDARARPPRRVPADRHRRPQRARRARPRPGGGDRGQRPLAAVALLRPDAPLEHPHAPCPTPTTDRTSKED